MDAIKEQSRTAALPDVRGAHGPGCLNDWLEPGYEPPRLLIPESIPYEEWKERRRGLIGASDAGAIMAWAESWPASDRPYGSALSVAHRLISGAGFDSREPQWGVRAPAEMGRLFEDSLWEMYQARSPHVEDLGKPGTYQNPSLDRIVATPDRIVRDPTRPEGLQRGLVQIKMVFSTGAAKWKRRGEVAIPAGVVAQMMQEMAVCGWASFNDCAVFIDSEPHVIRVEWCQSYWGRLADALQRFFHVVDNPEELPSLIDGSQDAAGVVEERSKERDEDIDLGQEWPGILERIEELKESKKQLDFDIRELETRLKSELGGASVGWCDGWRVTCRAQERRTLDGTKLKKEDPETWGKYIKTTKTRGVLRIGRVSNGVAG